MPTVVVVLLVACFGVALRLFAVPVTQARLDRFIAAHELDLTPAGRSRLHAYLAARRRWRVAGVVVAAAVGLLYSLPDNRVDFRLVPLLLGWLAGAIVAEAAQRRGSGRAAVPAPVPAWLILLPVIVAGLAAVWTTAAMVLRSVGTRDEIVLGWGIGGLVSTLALWAAVRYVRRRDLHGEEPIPATAVDAVRGLTVGGTGLALLCLAGVWAEAVPGPYDEAPELLPVVWLVAIALVMLLLNTAAASGGSQVRAVRLWWAAPFVAAVLPLLWAVPVRLAQEPPIDPQEVQATAELRLARPARVPAAQAELGLKPDRDLLRFADSFDEVTELVGRVDVARPAPRGSYYTLFGYDRRTKASVRLYGARGAGWHGMWSLVLPARYEWLSHVGARDSRGFSDGHVAASADPETGVLWFRTTVDEPGKFSADDLQLVLLLVRQETSYIYWASPVTSTARSL